MRRVRLLRRFRRSGCHRPFGRADRAGRQRQDGEGNKRQETERQFHVEKNERFFNRESTLIDANGGITSAGMFWAPDFFVCFVCFVVINFHPRVSNGLRYLRPLFPSLPPIQKIGFLRRSHRAPLFSALKIVDRAHKKGRGALAPASKGTK
jgi:hypothetical protein